MTVKRILRVGLTFITVGTPAALDTAAHKFKRIFRAEVTFIDVANLGQWIRVLLGKGVAAGTPAVGTTVVARYGAWGNATDRWGFCEDGGPWTPGEIAGLKLWVQADAITGLNDGDPVTTWTDLSGNGNSPTQATAAKKPLYKTGILNGKAGVRFDGVDDYLQAAFTLGQPNHVFVVAVQRGASQYGRLFDGAGAKNTVSQWNASSPATLYLEAASYQLTSLTWATNGAHLVRAKFNGASSALALGGGSYETKDIGVTSAGGLTLCSDKDGAYVGRFDVCEVLVYDSILSAGDEGKVREYVNARWGLT